MSATARCARCGAEPDGDSLSHDTGLCYGCEQEPEQAEQNACLAPVTSAQAREVGDNIARKLASAGPLTAASVRRRIHGSAVSNKKDPQS